MNTNNRLINRIVIVCGNNLFSAHGHMLQKTLGSDGSVILVAYLSFPNECEFVVMKMLIEGTGGVRFSHISRIFGPQVNRYR